MLNRIGVSLSVLTMFYFVLSSFLTCIWLYSLVVVGLRYLRLGLFSTYSKHRPFLKVAFWFLCFMSLILTIVDFALLQFEVSNLKIVVFDYLYSLFAFSILGVHWLISKKYR